MSGLGDLSISLTLGTAEFVSALEQSANRLGNFTTTLVQSGNQANSTFGNMQKYAGETDATCRELLATGLKLAAVFGVSFSVHAFADMVESSIAAQEQLGLLAEKIGTTAAAFSAMVPAAANTHTSLETIASASEKLSKNLAGFSGDSAKAVTALQAIGLNANDAARYLANPTQGLYEIGRALNNFQDDGNKAAIAMQLFGKSGADMLPFLKELGSQTELVNQRTNEQVAAARRMSDEMTAMSLATQKLKDQFVGELIPTFFDLRAIMERVTGESQGLKGSLADMMARGDLREWIMQGELGLARFADACITAKDAIHLFGGFVAVGIVQFLDYAAAIAAMPFAILTGQWEAVTDSLNHARDAGRAWAEEYTNFKVSHQITDAAQQVYDLAKAGQQAAASWKDNADKWDRYLLGMQGAPAVLKTIKVAHEETTSAADKFLEALQKQVDTFGMTTLEAKRYEAAALGVAGAAAENIAKLQALKAVQDDHNALIRDAAAQEKIYTDSLEKTINAQSKHWEALEKGNAELRLEITTLGMSIDQKAIYIASLELQAAKQRDAAGSTFDTRHEVEALTEKLDLLYTRAGSNELAEAAKESGKAWLETAHTIENSLEDAIMNGLKGGKSLFETFKSTVENMFKTMVLRPLLQPIAGGLASAFGGSTGSDAGFGMPGSTSGLGSLGGLFGGGFSGIGDSIFGAGGGAAFGQGMASPFSTMAGVLSDVAAGAEFAAPMMALATTIGAAIPMVGLALAAIAIIAPMFESGPADRTGNFGSNRGLGSGNQMFQSSSAFGTFGISNDKWFSDAEMGPALQAMLKTVSSLDNAIAAIVGKDSTAAITARLQGSRGYDFGTEHTDLNASGVIGTILKDRYVEVLNALDSRLGAVFSKFEGTGQELATFVTGLAALHVALDSIPSSISDDLIRALDGTSESLARVAATAIAFATAQDLMNRDPAADAMALLAATSGNAYDALMRQSSAIRFQVDALDESATGMNDLTKATSAYYSSQVQLLASIEQTKVAIDAMFSDTIRGFKLGTMTDDEKFAFYQNESGALMGQLGSTFDPDAIKHIAEQMNADLKEMFSMLSPSDQLAQLGHYTDVANWYDDVVKQRLAAVGATVEQTAAQILVQVRDGIANAAKDMADAATGQKAAAATNMAAAETPVNVAVSFRADIPGAAEVTVA